MPSRFDSAPPKSAVFFFKFFVCFEKFTYRYSALYAFHLRLFWHHFFSLHSTSRTSPSFILIGFTGIYRISFARTVITVIKELDVNFVVLHFCFVFFFFTLLAFSLHLLHLSHRYSLSKFSKHVRRSHLARIVNILVGVTAVLTKDLSKQSSKNTKPLIYR